MGGLKKSSSKKIPFFMSDFSAFSDFKVEAANQDSNTSEIFAGGFLSACAETAFSSRNDLQDPQGENHVQVHADRPRHCHARNAFRRSSRLYSPSEWAICTTRHARIQYPSSESGR